MQRDDDEEEEEEEEEEGREKGGEEDKGEEREDGDRVRDDDIHLPSSSLHPSFPMLPLPPPPTSSTLPVSCAFFISPSPSTPRCFPTRCVSRRVSR